MDRPLLAHTHLLYLSPWSCLNRHLKMQFQIVCFYLLLVFVQRRLAEGMCSGECSSWHHPSRSPHFRFVIHCIALYTIDSTEIAWEYFKMDKLCWGKSTLAYCRKADLDLVSLEIRQHGTHLGADAQYPQMPSMTSEIIMLWVGGGLETSWGPFQTKWSCDPSSTKQFLPDMEAHLSLWLSYINTKGTYSWTHVHKYDSPQKRRAF